MMARRWASNCRRCELTVVETEPGLKSATASSVTKPAKTETGLVVQVPPFINEGEKIRVDTAEGAYFSRALIQNTQQSAKAFTAKDSKDARRSRFGSSHCYG